MTIRRLFSAVLQWVLRQCWTKIGNVGFDLGNTLVNYVSLDILLSATSGPEMAQILDKSLKAVGLMGFRLNLDKTVLLTNQAHPPNTFVTKDGLILKVLDWNHGHKRLKCIVTACGGMMQRLDFAYHMEKKPKTWHAKSLDVKIKIYFDMYEAEIFQCLRVSNVLFWKRSRP